MSALKIEIKEPCSQIWSTMDKRDSGRFCRHCTKEVVDFTNFSDVELKNYFAQDIGKVCGRLNHFQLYQFNSTIEQKKDWKLKAGLIAASFLMIFSTPKSSAAVTNKLFTIEQHPFAKVTIDEKTLSTDPEFITVVGKIISFEDKTMLPGVLVKIAALNINAVTDATGNFTLRIPKQFATKQTILISYIGYETIEETIDFTKVREIKVTLEEAVGLMGEVVITRPMAPNFFKQTFYFLRNKINRLIN